MGPPEFHVLKTRRQYKPAQDRTVVVLEPDLWDDYGIESLFRVFVGKRDDWRPIGKWKILKIDSTGARRTNLPKTFSVLSSNYAALGQSIETYSQLLTLPPEFARAVLNALRDITFLPNPIALDNSDFKRSVLRFAGAKRASSIAPSMLKSAGILPKAEGEQYPTETHLSFSATLKGFEHPHEISCTFSNRRAYGGIGRLTVLVGTNGSGKTQLLAALAQSLSGLETQGTIVTSTQAYSRVIAISYSAFDNFSRPRIRGGVSYVYCGLRLPDAKKRRRGTIRNSPEANDHKIVLDLDGAITKAADDIAKMSDERRKAWTEALQTVGLDQLANSASEKTIQILNTQSAGQKLISLTLTNLVINLRVGSLVLHDEPEQHLHPSLLSAMLRAIHVLLDRFESHAILATHSLIPLQETPASHVVILDGPTGGPIKAHRPAAECFASPFDEISQSVFRESLEKTNYRTLLEKLHQSYDDEEIQQILGGQLSLGARLLLASLK